MAIRIIGVSGRAGSGKDTVSDYLVSRHGYTKISFAAILKNMLRVAGLPEPSNRDDKEALVDGFQFSWREAAQKLGTEWGRSLDSDIWVKLTMYSLRPSGLYVISDVRFDNEAEMVRKEGIIIHLDGRGIDMGNLSNHPSEAGVTKMPEDIVIYNTADKSSLFRTVDDCIKGCSDGTV